MLLPVLFLFGVITTMRTTRSRLNKGFSLEDRLAGATQSYEPNPSGWRGRWSQWAPHEGSRADSYRHVVLDLGCGKGEYTVECAAARPDTLFVGIDVDGVCVVRCAERAIAQGVTNAVFVFNEEDRDLSDFFAEGELSAVLLNFPTPFPKKKKAPLRLTYLDRLMAYRPLLAKGAPLRLRTDSMPMHEFSLTQLELAGYELLWNTDDVRSLFPEEPWSGYEQKLVAQGASVYGFAAVAGPEPEAVQQTAPLSLVSYLPDDLENMAYVPHGMQGCVRNMRGRNRNRRARGLPEWKKPIV